MATRWYVDLGNMFGGHHENFIFKSSAFKRAEEAKDSYPIIRIVDRLLNKTYDFKVPTEYPTPIYTDEGMLVGIEGDYEY